MFEAGHPCPFSIEFQTTPSCVSFVTFGTQPE